MFLLFSNAFAHPLVNEAQKHLNKPYVYCLKVSDSNTKGVETGRDSAWGAFVFGWFYGIFTKSWKKSVKCRFLIT